MLRRLRQYGDPFAIPRSPRERWFVRSSCEVALLNAQPFFVLDAQFVSNPIARCRRECAIPKKRTMWYLVIMALRFLWKALSETVVLRAANSRWRSLRTLAGSSWFRFNSRSMVRERFFAHSELPSFGRCLDFSLYFCFLNLEPPSLASGAGEPCSESGEATCEKSLLSPIA